jgi:hypothetical protein
MYSKGVSWIDDCRIPHSEEIMVAIDYKETKQSENGWNTKNRILEPSNRGRFPANILVSDDMLNDGVINGGGNYSGIKTRERIKFFNERGVMNSTAQSPDNYGDKGSNSRYYNIDKWFENLIK